MKTHFVFTFVFARVFFCSVASAAPGFKVLSDAHPLLRSPQAVSSSGTSAHGRAGEGEIRGQLFFSTAQMDLEIPDCRKVNASFTAATLLRLKEVSALVDHFFVCVPTSETSSVFVYQIFTEPTDASRVDQFRKIIADINTTPVLGFQPQFEQASGFAIDREVVLSIPGKKTVLRVPSGGSLGSLAAFLKFLSSENTIFRRLAVEDFYRHITSLVGENGLSRITEVLTPEMWVTSYHLPNLVLESGKIITGPVTYGNYRDCSKEATPCF